jgi:hypothetical protein
VGGVHGIERIGSQVLTSLLGMLNERLKWDEKMIAMLNELRIVSIPILNPGGMLKNTRANLNGVDLMRNAPIDADQDPPFLLGGQKISKQLPWFRGGEQMEIESNVLIGAVTAELERASYCMAIDFHSGFGIQDQLWFPFATSVRPFDQLAEVWSLKKLMDQNLPYHFYKFEPQSKNYITHGDLWDYLYFENSKSKQIPFLPMTLEMGSWMWVKKNPTQIFNLDGLFNPIKEHRQKRILRRQWTLFEFLISATAYWQKWMHLEAEERNVNDALALEAWYK